MGSLDVNGTVRGLVEAHQPSSYVGVDISSGPGVDQLCDAEGLIDRFGPSSFDLIICTEMLEHVLDWRAVVMNLKGVLAIDGALLLTTRSKGFRFHGYPADFWRFSLSDMRAIFSDMSIEALEPDSPESPGVMVFARSNSAGQVDLEPISVYSVIRRRRTHRATRLDWWSSLALAGARKQGKRVLPDPAWNAVRAHLGRNAVEGTE